MKNLLKILLATLAISSLLSLAWWFWPARTTAINPESNHSTATLDYIELGGTQQSVLIRSHDLRNPILLFLHGGPGMPMMYLAHEFQRPLERHFTVVQWDRRGAGKTYFKNIPAPESLNTRQLVNDAYQLIDSLRNRYNQDRIYLAAHSFGTILGSIMSTERPELFAAFVSIGQVVDEEGARTLQIEFIKEHAKKHERDDILQEIQRGSLTNMESWLFEFGAELKASKSFFPLIWSGLQAPEYTLPEAIKLAAGSSYSSRHMKDNILQGAAISQIKTYQIPVYFFAGRHDYVTPTSLIEEYYLQIDAPEKELIIFDESAHFPFYEQPEEFAKELIRILLQL